MALKTARNNSKPFKTPEVQYNDKILDTLAVIVAEETRCVTLEGSIRSAKTVTAIIGFHRLVQNMTAKYALIAAEDFNAIRTNLLEAEIGLLTLYPDKYRMMSPQIGGKYIEASTPGGTKEILLAGYADKSKWEKILGKDIEIVFIDEVNIADEQFVRETFARQGATNHPVTLFTLNGDDPLHLIYQERVNKSLIFGKVPASIRAEMAAAKVKKRGYYYAHFTFEDNPKLSRKQIRELKTLFPSGSFYHKTRILGERGKWGVMIYADYMTQDLLVDLSAIDPITKLPMYPIQKYVLGIDIAEGRASNVFALLGFDKTYSRCYLVDLLVFKSENAHGNAGYKFKTEMLKSFLTRHKGKPIECISVDSAEENYIRDLKGERLGYDVIGAYKATIKARIDLNIILFSKKRFFFDIKTIQGFQAFQAAVWVKGKEGTEREDNNLPMNDIMDAVEYAETVHMKALSFGEKR